MDKKTGFIVGYGVDGTLEHVVEAKNLPTWLRDCARVVYVEASDSREALKAARNMKYMRLA